MSTRGKNTEVTIKRSKKEINVNVDLSFQTDDLKIVIPPSKKTFVEICDAFSFDEPRHKKPKSDKRRTKQEIIKAMEQSGRIISHDIRFKYNVHRH